MDNTPAGPEGRRDLIAETPAALRPLYLAAGFVLLALGIVGAFVPLMPTTIMLILAAWCFARSSPRLEAKILSHKKFGPIVVAWRDEGAISRRSKILACSGMAVGFVIFLIGAQPKPWLLVLVLAFFAACAWYVVSRPLPRSEAGSEGDA